MTQTQLDSENFHMGELSCYSTLYIQLNTSSRGLTHHRVTSFDTIRLKVNERYAVDSGTLDKRGNRYYYLSNFGHVS